MERQITCRVSAELYDELGRRAAVEGVPRSELIRRALEGYLWAEEGKEYPYARVRDLIGSVAGGPPDLAERHREYLAGLIRDRR